MLVIVGLIVLLLVGLVAIVGVLTNAGAGHPPIENFVVFGYHPAGSTGTLFLLGIMVGVVASLGFAALITGARRSASRAADIRRAAARIRRETAFINRDHDTRREYQQRADIAPNANAVEGVPTHQLKRPTSLPTQSF